MSDIVAIGEMLIDFTASINADNEVVYKRNAGGAPANVAVMAAKLGVSAGFIGKVGKDMFGQYLKQTLVDNGVNVDGLILDKNYATALAFVGKDEVGERDFVFYRRDSADLNLNYQEVRLKLVDGCKIFHFGSLMLTNEPSRSAALLTAEYAKQHGKIVTYDPNYRERLWTSKQEAQSAMQSVLKLVDIIKVSESELQIITDCGNMLPAIAKLLDTGVKIICITQGAKGCIIATKHGIERVGAYNVETVDTLGAGDSFFGAFLAKLVLSVKSVDTIDMTELREIALYANACGALSSTKEGAIPAMPTDEEIKALCEKSKIM